MAEFRSTRPAIARRSARGVELEISQPIANNSDTIANYASPRGAAKRFEFLANAPTSSVVPYLAREHSQTIAVVLAHLEPARAAAVLGALPEKLQAETIERLSVLGETDPESVTVVERELAAWIASRSENRGTTARRRETVANILAAADVKTRDNILNRLKKSHGTFVEQFARSEHTPPTNHAGAPAADKRRREPLRHYESKQAAHTNAVIQQHMAGAAGPAPSPPPAAPRPAPLPCVDFDQLTSLDGSALSCVIRDVDARVLAIALAGSRRELVDRICAQMPKRIGRDFRRELRRLGPMRLSDVETAQRVVADAAARHLAQRRGLSVASQ
jgi:flagellar motor switch protein FliG